MSDCHLLPFSICVADRGRLHDWCSAERASPLSPFDTLAPRFDTTLKHHASTPNTLRHRPRSETLLWHARPPPSPQPPSGFSEAAGLVDVRTADWSAEVAPFWRAVIATALTGQGLSGLLRAGWTTIKVRVVCVGERASERRATVETGGGKGEGESQ